MAFQALPDIKREEVLRVVKTRGPVIPNEIKKVLKVGDTILLGAMLSELATNGFVKVSKTKLGGSPFYYDPARPESLERIAVHLNEKERRSYELLRAQGILCDEEQDALTRVTLRAIKDYAVPLTVTTPTGPKLFWKYFILSDAEAERRIRQHLGTKQETPEARREEPAGAARQAPTMARPAANRPTAGSTVDASAHESRQTTDAQPAHSSPTPPRTLSRAPRQKQLPHATTPARRPRTPRAAPSLLPKDPFLETITAFLTKRGIAILDATVVRKNRELDLIVSLPTPVGKATYYCKAKRKKKSADGDLASAQLHGLTRQLPVLYLSTGEVTKKARAAREFAGMLIQQVT